MYSTTGALSDETRRGRVCGVRTRYRCMWTDTMCACAHAAVRHERGGHDVGMAEGEIVKRSAKGRVRTLGQGGPLAGGRLEGIW